MMYKASNLKLLLNSPILDVASFSVHKIALGNGAGIDSNIIVNVGDKIAKGECIAKKVDGTFSDNIYSSVCGTIRSVELDKVPTGKAICVTIDVDLESQDNKFLEPIDGFDKDSLINRLKDFDLYDKSFIENKTINIDFSCKDKYEPIDAVLLHKYSVEIVEAIKILSALDFKCNVYIDKFVKKKIKTLIKENSLKLNIVKKQPDYSCDSRHMIDVYNAVRFGKPPIETFVIINGGASKNPCMAKVKLGTMVSEIVIASGGEKFPYVQYKYAENIASETYGEYLELRAEYDGAPEKDKVELMQEIVAKRKKANKNIIDFLMIQKKFEKHLMKQIVINGYKNGEIREDFDYPVCKNTSSVLLLTSREMKPIINKGEK